MRVVRGESDKALNAVMRRLTWNIRHTGIGGGGGWCGEGGLCFARLVVSRRQLRMGGGVKGNGRRQIVIPLPHFSGFLSYKVKSNLSQATVIAEYWGQVGYC